MNWELHHAIVMSTIPDECDVKQPNMHIQFQFVARMLTVVDDHLNVLHDQEIILDLNQMHSSTYNNIKIDLQDFWK